MNSKTTLFLIIMFFLQSFVSVSAATDIGQFTNPSSKPTQIFLDETRLKETKTLRIFYKANDLITDEKYPASLKAELYIYDESSDRKLLKVLNKTIKSNKSAKNVIFKTQLDLLKDGDTLYLDLFDTHNTYYATYFYIVNFEASISDTPSLGTISSMDCDKDEPECLLEFFMKNVNFVASYDKRLITEVSRELNGTYNVVLPIKRGRKLKRKVNKFDIDQGDGSGIASADGYYPFFGVNGTEAGAINFNESSGINFSLNGTQEAFTILNSGGVKIGESDLSSDPIDGALEFDGSNIYMTANGSRMKIATGETSVGAQGPQGPQGPAGPAGAGITGDILSNGGTVNGVINFVGNGTLQDPVINGSLFLPSGAVNGHVLSSDANGLATWTSVAALSGNGDDLGNHIATTTLDLAGENIANGGMATFSGAASIKTVINTGAPHWGVSIVPSAATAGWARSYNFFGNGEALGAFGGRGTGQDLDYMYISTDNGLSQHLDPNATYFDLNGNVGIAENNPQARLHVRGDVAIVDGTQANGFVLSSDANGIASWVSTGSLINGELASRDSSGVAGSVQFSDGVNGFNSDASNFFWDNGTKRLGLGIAAPSAALHVNGFALIGDSATNTVAIGSFAALNSNGDRINALGDRAAADSIGDDINAFGTTAARYSNGSYVNALGFLAARVSVGSSVNALGYYAAEENNGSNVNAMGSLAARHNNGDFVNALGFYAARSNSQNSVNAFGYYAGEQNNGASLNALGSTAARYNQGDDVNALGYLTARNNSGNNVNALNDRAAQYNNGNNINALGYFAAIHNNGNNINAFGSVVARNNLGDNLNAFGNRAAEENQGNDLNALGIYSARYNSGDDVTAIGAYAAQYNNGDGAIAIGRRSLFYNNGDYNVAIGYEAGENLVNGSENILIGHSAEAVDNNDDYQLNIGNTIYGDLANGEIALGVAKTNPDATLELNGSFLYRDGNEADGFILSSDANGLATWVSPGSLINGGLAVRDSSGIAGAVQFSDGANGFNSDAANFFWDDANGRLGIGTTTPNNALHVSGAITASSYFITGQSIFHNLNGIYRSATGRANIKVGTVATATGAYPIELTSGNGGTYSDGHISMFTNGTEQARLNSSGNLGLGTISPAARLQVNGFALIGDPTNFVVAIGERAANNMIAANSLYVNAIGHTAALLNNGSHINAFGALAARDNEGDNVNALGQNAAIYNEGDAVNALGAHSAYQNLGDNVNAFGPSSAQRNNGDDVNAFGYRAAFGNNGDGVIAIGRDTLDQNNGDYNIAIGHEAGGILNDGSENILIGHGAEAIDNNGDFQLNIGDTVFGDLANGEIALGIAKTSPDATLELNGSFLYRDGNEANGYILTSDINGQATWQLAPTGVGVNGTAAGAAGAVQFSDGANGFNADENNFYWDTAANYAIIGDRTLNGTALGSNAAQNNSGEYVNAIGNNAARHNLRDNVNAFGSYAAYANNGTDLNAIGFYAARDNDGDNVNAIGAHAGRSNIGDNVNAFGIDASRFNRKNHVNALGYYAARNNNGDNLNSMGYLAGQDNLGDNVNAFGLESGENNIGTNVNALGYFTARNNNGSNLNTFGYYATESNIGTDVNALGRQAARYNNGDNLNALGYFAGLSNKGSFVNAFGRQAGHSNLQNHLNAFGGYAGESNNGSSVNALGYLSARNNIGDNVNALGLNAAANNQGDYVNALGYYAANGNISDYVNAIGHYSAEGNTGTRVNALGLFAAQNNTADYVIAVGNNAARENTGAQIQVFGPSAARFNTGSNLIAMGVRSASVNSGNGVVALGYEALQSNNGDFNIAVGLQAGANMNNGSDNILIGHDVQGLDNNGDFQLNIGDTIYGDLNNGEIALGVAKTNPDATLELNGSFLYRDGNEANGLVLTSDANGQATWTDITSLASNGDDLGNHTATDNLDLATHSITGIVSANGTNANFTNVNATNFEGGTYNGTFIGTLSPKKVNNMYVAQNIWNIGTNATQSVSQIGLAMNSLLGADTGRYTLSYTGAYAGSDSGLYDGIYSTAISIATGVTFIDEIDLAPQVSYTANTPSGMTYPEGRMILSFYSTSLPENVTVEVYRYNSGTGLDEWFTVYTTTTNDSSPLAIDFPSSNYMKRMRVTMSDPDNPIWLTEMEFFPRRETTTRSLSNIPRFSASALDLGLNELKFRDLSWTETASITDNGVITAQLFNGAFIGDGSGLTGLASSVGTAGTVQFSDGTGDFNGDASNFFWNDATNRLGINTSGPAAALQVNGFALIGYPNLATVAIGAGAASNMVTANSLYVNAFGNNAANNNNGTDLNALGFGAANFNTGGNINALGNAAAERNTGYAVNAFGRQSGRYNNGDYLNALGHLAGQYNNGDYVNSMGYQTAQNNNGDHVNAFGYQAAQNNFGSHVIAMGQFAANDNTANFVQAFGSYAADNNTGSNVVAIGDNAAAGNSGIGVIGIGQNAVQFNTGGYHVTGIGLNSAQRNSARDVHGMGHNAVYHNSGAYVGGLGQGVAMYNNGDYVNAFGVFAARENNGDYVNAFGYYAASDNHGEDITAIGDFAARYNEGNGTVAIGKSTLENNKGDYNIALGYDAGSNLNNGAENILIGHGVEAIDNNGDFQLNIGDTIFGDLNNGEVALGIAKTNPDATLEVNGSFLYRDGNEANGRVLTSDANGNASWGLPTGGYPTMSGFSVNTASSTSFPSTYPAYTKLTFTIEDYDTQSAYNTTTGRFTPTEAGYYEFRLEVRISNQTDNDVVITRIEKNGTAVCDHYAWMSWSQANSSTCSRTVYMNGTTDYIETFITHGSGFTQTVDNANYATFFEGRKVAN